MDELDDVVTLGSKKPRKTKHKAIATEAVTEDVDYSYDELLKRIRSLLDKTSSDVEMAIKLPPPKLMLKGTRRVCIMNFDKICSALRRPADHVMYFMQVEFGTQVSIDEETKTVIIKGKISQRMVEMALSRYAKEYVLCKQCKSSDTVLEKENRLFFISCQHCKARVSVTQVKQGFQAKTKKVRKDLV